MKSKLSPPPLLLGRSVAPRKPNAACGGTRAADLGFWRSRRNLQTMLLRCRSLACPFDQVLTYLHVAPRALS